METEPELAASNSITSSASGAQTGSRAVTVLPDFFTGGPDQRWLDWVEDFDLDQRLDTGTAKAILAHSLERGAT